MEKKFFWLKYFLNTFGTCKELWITSIKEQKNPNVKIINNRLSIRRFIQHSKKYFFTFVRQRKNKKIQNKNEKWKRKNKSRTQMEKMTKRQNLCQKVFFVKIQINKGVIPSSKY